MSETEAMEPERDQEVLAIFIEESLEGLARVESLLLEAEKGQRAADIFTHVFRDIHTIKGTSGYLSLPKILALSHVGEDLLSKLRSDPSQANPEHFSQMLVVVEVLRRMVERVRTHADEGPDSIDALVEKLEAQVHALPSDGDEAYQAPSAPASEARVVAQGVPATPAPTPPRPLPEANVAPRPAAPSQAAASSPASPEKETGAEDAKRLDNAEGTVRIGVGVLDRLMNLMGELVLARNQIVQILKTNRDAPSVAVCQRLSMVTTDLQEQIMKTRMQPAARVFEKIPRQVRDLAQATGKRVECVVDGSTTEIDRALIEAIRDPVMHAVRNSMDHGIETPAERLAAGKPEQGVLAVRAFHEGSSVTIEITDDGRGIDPVKVTAHAVRKGVISASEATRLSEREAIELIFRPGFSTAEQVTQISGRGVGMDVVRSRVERAGGKVEISSVVGRGTELRLKMPLTLAILPALMVRSGAQRFAIPQANLTELLHLSPAQAAKRIEFVRGAPVYRLRGEILPLVDLAAALGTSKRASAATEGMDVVVVEVGSCRYGLVVDAIDDTEEIVIKPLQGALKRLSCYSGATVLGDGGLALILEITGLAAIAGISLTARHEPEAKQKVDAGSTLALLVFTAGGGVRCAVPLSMVTRLERIPQNTIEHLAGHEVVQYRNRLMPVVRPEAVMPLGEGTRPEEQQLLVFDFGRVVALAVEEIVDVTTVEVGGDAFGGAQAYTQGRVVAFGRTTLIIDIFGMMRDRFPELVSERRGKVPLRPVVLVADAGNSLRTAVCAHLRTKGFDVHELSSVEALHAALKVPRAGGISAVVLDSELERTGSLVVSLRRDRPEIPLLVWGHQDDDDDGRREAVLKAGAAAWVSKLDRDEVAQKLEQLTEGQRRRASDSRPRGDRDLGQGALTPSMDTRAA